MAARVKITVGHFLIALLLGVGALHFSGGLSSPSWLGAHTTAAKDEVDSLVGLFRSGAAPTPVMVATRPVEVPKPVAAPAVVASASAPVAAVPPAPAATPAVVRDTVALPSAPAKHGRAKKAAPKKKFAREKHALPSASAVSSKAVSTVSPKPTLTDTPSKVNRRTADPDRRLVGKFVNLDLVSGRSVKGVLEEKTSTVYRLEMPGLGTLEYPVSDVKSIKSAE